MEVFPSSSEEFASSSEEFASSGDTLPSSNEASVGTIKTIPTTKNEEVKT
jgi:hypothetical protein